MSRCRRAARLLSAVVAACALLVPATHVAADPGQTAPVLSAQATVGGDFTVTVTGSVVGEGKPVTGVAVRGSVAGRDVGAAATDAGGSFTLAFALPEDLRAAPQTVTLTTEPRGSLASASLTVPLAAAAPTSVAPPAKSKLKLSASVDKTDVSPGSLITVDGTLKTADGSPVRSAQIDLLLDGDLMDESTVLTDSKGRFATFFEMPMGEPAGQPTLRVSFAGSDRLEAAAKKLVLTVTLDSPEPSATPTASGSATATVAESSAVAGESASPTTSPSPDASPSADATPATPPGVSPWAWFLAGLVAVGGTALLVTGFLVFRGWRAGRGAETDTLDLLTDPDDDDFEDPILPEEGAHLSEDVGEEIEATEIPELPEDPPAIPRRGM